MLVPLAACIIVLTFMDHWTTYLCLRDAVPGWLVSEGNPLAAHLFDSVGLVPGLAIDSVITLGALAFLLQTRLIPPRAKALMLCLLLFTTGFAVTNNLDAIFALDLSLLGRS